MDTQTQKGFITRFGELIDQSRAEREQKQADATVQAPKANKLSRLVRWLLPNGGTLLIVLFLIATQSVWSLPLRSPSATSTSTINYQGRLADTAGEPLTGMYNMVFRIYDVPTGGSPLWDENWVTGNSVEVSDGLFNVMLGSINNTLAGTIAGHDELYLGIAVGTDNEMTPRVQLGSVPFSFQAQEALTVPDDSITSDKIVDGTITQSDAPSLVKSGNGSNIKIQYGSATIGLEHDPDSNMYYRDITFPEPFATTNYEVFVEQEWNTGGGGWHTHVVKQSSKTTTGCRVMSTAVGHWSFSWVAVGE